MKNIGQAFDTDRFLADVKAFAQRHGHSKNDVSNITMISKHTLDFIGKVTPRYGVHIQSMARLAVYADLDLHSYFLVHNSNGLVRVKK